MMGSIALPLTILAPILAGISSFVPSAPDLLLSYGVDLLPAPTSHIASQNVTYVGSRTPGVEHFRGIFYGADTSGVNRFAPPVPYVPTAGSVIDATHPGAYCPQGKGDAPLPFASPIQNISENCLSLKVARPRGTTADSKLPVMVWLHGGGHALGSGEDRLYEPDGLIKGSVHEGSPVVWVAVNYRLGMFGFADSKALREQGHLNAGLKDQRAALEWVRDNIDAFGGDSKQITAIGQSVGASDIGLHLVSYGGAKGVPFQKAVMMSGAPGLVFHPDSDLVANNTAAVASGIDCVKDGSADSAATLACLRSAPMDSILDLSVSAARAARPPFGEGFFYPLIDGDYIPERPSELVRAGRVAKDVPVIASWVTNEGAWYALPTTASDEEAAGSFGLWLYKLSSPVLSKLLSLYPLTDFAHMVRESDGPISPQYYRAAQMNRDIWFTCPVLDFTYNYAKTGAGVRLYEHNKTRFAPIYEMMGVPMWRVAHLSDIPYVLNGHVHGGGDNSEEQLKLSKLVSGSILRFATSDKAHGGKSGVKSWPEAYTKLNGVDPEELSMTLFNGPDGSGTVSVTKGTKGSSENEKAVLAAKVFERCEFINSEVFRAEIGV